MNLKKKIIILFCIFIFANNCNAKSSLDIESEKALKNILDLNQSINDFLFTNDKNLPNVSSLLNSIAKAKKDSKNSDVKATLEKMEKSVAQMSSATDREVFFKGFSKFSEDLSEITKKFNLHGGFNRFFCPMVSKTWVAKGTQIKNPYASDMRDCGELVK